MKMDITFARGREEGFWTDRAFLQKPTRSFPEDFLCLQCDDAILLQGHHWPAN